MGEVSMRPSWPRSQGIALVVCLLMMLVILLLGASGAQIALQEEKASRFERDRIVAFQAAEAAMRDAEIDIERSGRIAHFSAGRTRAGECGAGLGNPLLGLCRPAPPELFPVWQKIALGSKRISVPYEQITGRVLTGSDLAQPPAYLIEVLGGPAYRITTIGYGSNGRTQVVLQSYFHKPANGAGRRLGWREILNWEEVREVLEGS